MSINKQIAITAFALFALFFGAGNLILPPLLGYQAGGQWGWVTLGFALSAVVIPILAIIAHGRIQGSMFDFPKPISTQVAWVYCILVYAISISLPAPRTASVTYEMAFEPYMQVPSILISAIYFTAVLIVVLNRAKILNLVGKFLTPLIVIILVLIIGLSVFLEIPQASIIAIENPITKGILEGYQTFDAIGGVVVGGVIVISLQLTGLWSFKEKKHILSRAGILAGLGLLFIYGGLIWVGSQWAGSFTTAPTRTALLQHISNTTLGNFGTLFLAVLVALACFTTAVGIITGTADFVKGRFNNSEKAYKITTWVGCFLGVVIGQLDVHVIINVALPALMFIYPITVVLILLHILPKNIQTPLLFKGTVSCAFVFSIPDFVSFFWQPNFLINLQKFVPFVEDNLGWVFPSFLVGFIIVLFQNKIKAS